MCGRSSSEREREKEATLLPREQRAHLHFCEYFGTTLTSLTRLRNKPKRRTALPFLYIFFFFSLTFERGDINLRRMYAYAIAQTKKKKKIGRSPRDYRARSLIKFQIGCAGKQWWSCVCCKFALFN